MTLFKRKFKLLILLLLAFVPLKRIDAEVLDKQNEKTNNVFANQELLSPVFEKLLNLERNKKGKVNIVHIGDSHIQADLFTNTIREALQFKFGDAGLGFTFPYSLVKTNGPRFVKYASTAVWQSLLNVYPVADVGVGLSGIALYTQSNDFVLQLFANKGYEFNTIKIIYPSQEDFYKMSVSAEPLEITSASNQAISLGVKYHTVKSGESLSLISKKYGVTVSQIKSANGLRSNMIKPKQRLKIPTKARKTAPKVFTSNIKEEETDFVNLVSKPYYSTYTSDTLLNRITILPGDKKNAMYNLNGFVVENKKPGVIYHSIGVNGAKLSDYNKYPLFFKQLPILSPDLVVLSFGTNESFGKLSVNEYIYQLKEFVTNIKRMGINPTILVMTPPPSMFRRQRPNTYVTDYSVALMELNNLPVWDLYTRMGGLSGIKPKGEYSAMIARDKVHYTQRGYEAQGALFASDFIDAYNNFKNKRKVENITEH